MNPLDEFRARWAAVPMPLPLVDVVNTPVDLDDMPDAWAGALDQGDSRADVTMGSNPWTEHNGQIFVGLFAKSGTGLVAMNLAIDALRFYFQGYRTAGDGLRFPTVIGPEDTDPEATGVWWHINMRVPYVVQGRRVEPLVP